MKLAIIIKVVFTAAAVCFCFVCWWHAAHAATQAEEAAGATPKAQIKELFDARCARCHGRDGRGETRLGAMLGVPNFTDGEWWQQQGASDERLRASITNGRGEMPAFGKRLTKHEISALAVYVRAFSKAAH